MSWVLEYCYVGQERESKHCKGFTGTSDDVLFIFGARGASRVE